MKEYEVKQYFSGYVQGFKSVSVLANSEEEAIKIAKENGFWYDIALTKEETSVLDTTASEL